MFRLSILTIIKDEARYLPEWIEYHRILGVEHFFIFNNNSTDDISSVLRKYINYGLVTLVEWPFHPGQVYAYSYGLRVFGALSEWVAVIDIDEFISMPSGLDIRGFLDTLDADQILIPWAMFGSSGHESKPDGLVIENYIHRASAPSHIVKSIVRPNAVVQAEVHQSRTKKRRTINERLERIPETWRQANTSYDIIRINHYFVKSKEEWEAKIRRGDAANNKRTMQDFLNNDRNDILDDTVALRAGEVRSAIERMAALPDVPFGYAPMSKLSEISTVREWFVLAHKTIQATQKSLVNSAAWSCDFLPDRAIMMSETIDPHTAFQFDVELKKFESQIDGSCVTEWTTGEALKGLPRAFSLAVASRLFVAGVVETAKSEILTVSIVGRSSTGEPVAVDTKIAVEPGVCAFIVAITRGAIQAGEVGITTCETSESKCYAPLLKVMSYM